MFTAQVGVYLPLSSKGTWMINHGAARARRVDARHTPEGLAGWLGAAGPERTAGGASSRAVNKHIQV